MIQTTASDHFKKAFRLRGSKIARPRFQVGLVSSTGCPDNSHICMRFCGCVCAGVCALVCVCVCVRVFACAWVYAWLQMLYVSLRRSSCTQHKASLPADSAQTKQPRSISSHLIPTTPVWLEVSSTNPGARHTLTRLTQSQCSYERRLSVLA